MQDPALYVTGKATSVWRVKSALTLYGIPDWIPWKLITLWDSATTNGII